MKLTFENILKHDPELAQAIQRIRQLPEKVLQFGTGVLLRGLPDYYIDRANKQGIFNGRIVVIKSTDKGSSDDFELQDNLFTHCIRGFENEQSVSNNLLNASISRVLNAREQWKDILECAKNTELRVIVSNTTEMGIQLVKENIFLDPPASFPAKLLRFLFERYRFFGSSPEAGMVIVPTELIPGNGNKLKSIVLELASFNQLDPGFIEWLDSSNRFCNSLVDRIVPGKPSGETLESLYKELMYEDALLIVSEPYSLWAIEGDEFVKDRLSFYKVDPTVIIEKDIEKYRELKLRLLNGTHTLSCAMSILMGFEMVHESMKDELMKTFIMKLMKEEIGQSIPGIPRSEIISFSNQVIDRFRNPYINHKWSSISFQSTSKMVLRNIPVLLEWYKQYHMPPPLFSLGFSAFLMYMRPENREGVFYSKQPGKDYLIDDQQAGYFANKWSRYLSVNLTPGINKDHLVPEEIIREIFGDVSVWGTDLNLLPGFCETVIKDMNTISSAGMRSALRNVINLQAE